MKNQIGPAVRLFLAMTFLTGVIYPLVMAGITQTIFPSQAKGSLITRNGAVVGSELIAQKFESPRYFWARPSAGDYNPLPSGGTNLAPISAKLKEAADKQKARYSGNVPQDLLFASASGLDPHVSPEAARFQMERVAQARGFSDEKRSALSALVDKYSEGRQIGFLGEARVNVLELNIALDDMDR